MSAPILSIGLFALLAIVAGCDSDVRSSSAWSSQAACIQDHVNASEGAFLAPLNGNNPADLSRYCEWAFRTGRSDFRSEVELTKWRFAVLGPGSQYKNRLAAYFSKAR